MSLLDELKNAILKENFYETNNILEKVSKDDNCYDYISVLINIMENNPNIDFGMPGPIVHFIEKYPEEDYVDILLASLKRKPTVHTLWMLNRIINDPASVRKTEYINVLLEISNKIEYSKIIRDQAKDYYEYQREK